MRCDVTWANGSITELGGSCYINIIMYKQLAIPECKIIIECKNDIVKTCFAVPINTTDWGGGDCIEGIFKDNVLEGDSDATIN